MADIFCNPAAFAPFFSTPVTLRCVGADRKNLTTTVQACVLDMGLDDPLAESDQQSAYSRISVRIHERDLSGITPRIKDRILLEDARAYGVAEVTRAHGDWVLVCRGAR